METADNTAMHVTETKTLCSSPNCPKTKNEDITREREEELLYGSNEDGDDEDALSDDSFRLRVSDEGEEQQATNRDLTEEVMKQKSTELELGSDVPPPDITERKSLLKCENLTNGKCTIENHLSHHVEGANEGMHVEDSFNGDIDKNVTASIEASKIGNAPIDKWHYSGRFGEYSRSGKLNIVPRQSYVMNSCSDKYYNQNTHYGRGKICVKGYSLHNTKGSRLNIEASSPNDIRSNLGVSSCLESTIDRSKSKQDTDSIRSPNVNAECTRVEASSAANTCSSEFATKLEDDAVAYDVSTNIVLEPTDILTKNDNAEAAYNCTNNYESTFQVNQDKNVSSKAERSSPIMDNEASEFDIDGDRAVVRVINETDSDPPVRESVNATEIHAGEKAWSIRIPSNNIEGEVELPNNLSEFKTEESETFEGIKENKKFEHTDDSTNDGNVSENTREAENNENLASERNNEMIQNEKVTVEVAEAKTHETDTAGEVTDCSNDTGAESEETYATINDAQVTSEVTSDSENDKITAPGTSNGFTHDEKATAETVNEYAKLGESMPNSIVPNHEKESLDRDKTDVIKVDDREKDIVESVDETLDQTSKSSDRSTQSESVKEDADRCAESLFGRPSVSPEMLTNLRALKLPKDLLIVAIVEPKTNEDGSAFFPIEPDTAAIPKSPLTDNEKKDFSADDDDGARDGPSSDRVDDNATIFRCSLKRASTDILLDEMELSKRLQIDRDRGDVTSESGNKAIHYAQVSSVTVQIDTTTGRKDTSILENTVTNNNGESSDLAPEESIISNNVVDKSSISERSVEGKILPAVTESQEIDDDEKIDDCEVIEIPIKRKQKRSRRSLNNLRESIVSQEDSQETENIRQKRKTAQNAEEIIRKECLANTDSESNDSLSKFVTINHRTNNNLRPTSPPTLKRNFVDDDEAKDVGTTTKKLKADATLNGDISTNNESVESQTKQTLQHVRNFFRRDANGSLCKLMQEELEELLIQKVVETITMKGEIGKLREQAKAAERNQEATRIRCQQLAKQIKDLDMVLNRFKSDLRSNPDSKTVVPIKINRSVGLQVNFVTDHGIQNLRQLQQVQKMTGSTVDGTIALQHQQQMQQQKQPPQQAQLPSEPTASGPAVKRTVKVRSPRRPEHLSTAPVATAVSTPVNNPHVSTAAPAALVVSKPVSDLRPSVTPANQQITVMHPQLISSNQAILVNGSVTQPIRQAPTLQACKAKNSDLIDLTQEEEKTKPPVVTQNTVLTAALTETSPSVSNIQKLAPRFHSVIQTIPNMSITTQSGIRVVQPSSQPTPTALVNNMNAPRLTYVTMQSGIVPRQVVLTSAPTPIRPAPTNNIRTTFPISGTITNNTVRVMPATGTTTLLYKHPAALPESLNPLSSPSWKLPPPAPSLKISKVANGIVLSWNMALSDKFADIASYQLYAYQELTGMAPSSTLWKKVGDVRALPLPMACTLTQFSEGNNYYFAVRAVDKHSRLGQYSQPGNISL